jgi:hypothetical protein
MKHELTMDVPRAFAALGLEPRGSTEKSIRAAHRRRMRLVHPDRFYGTPQERLAEEQAKALNCALDVALRFVRDRMPRDRGTGEQHLTRGGRVRRARCWNCDEVQTVIAAVAEICECVECGARFQLTFTEATRWTARDVHAR